MQTKYTSDKQMRKVEQTHAILFIIMQPDNAHISDEIEGLKARIEAVYVSVEKTRKYFLWTMISVALFVLPLIGLMFVLPSFMSNYVGSLQGATGSGTSTVDVQGIEQSLGF